MIEFGPVVFTQPFLLFLLLLLPGLVLLLRITPPTAREIHFPAVRLLKRLSAKKDEMAKTPLWLLLLRLAIAALIILGFARPLLNPTGGFLDRGPVILVVDDGWASAAHWDQRRQAMEEIIDQAERRERPILLITTAPPKGLTPKAIGAGLLERMVPAGEARDLVRTLSPKPWPVDRARVVDALRPLTLNTTALAVWLSDGIDDGAGRALAERLQNFGRLDVVLPTTLNAPLVLAPPESTPDGLSLTVRRYGAPVPAAQNIGVLARDESGVILARQALTLDAGAESGSAFLELPTELRNRIAGLKIEGETSAGALVLLDERWRRRPVGLMSRGRANQGLPLLGDLYFLERALNADAEVRVGDIKTLLQRDLSMLILADVARMSEKEREALTTWVEDGGILVRFAGPHMGGARFVEAPADQLGADDPLLPVPLRRGERSLGGSLSWQRPLSIGAFAEHGPFAGLAVPDDVRIRTQILTEAVSTVDQRSWASLSDGTPLVTGKALGKGQVVLFHTAAGPEWSDLPLSGIFPRMLKRLLEASQSVGGTIAQDDALPGLRVVDGFGVLTAPDGTVFPLKRGDGVGPTHPPGYYGHGTLRHAVNLSPAIAPYTPLPTPPGVFTKGYDALSNEMDLKPWLLTAALILLIADTLVAFWIKGIVGMPSMVRRAVRIGGVLLALGLPFGAQAADTPLDPATIEAALQTRLAYVRTGPENDALAAAGLQYLTRVLADRSAAELAPPMGVDLDTDTLVVFPLLYWPVTLGQTPPSPGVADKLNAYMRHGGMILFDTRDGSAKSLLERDEAAQTLKRILARLEIPSLMTLPNNHVLNRSFYLLRNHAGRTDGGAVWVARESSDSDGVTPVIIGSNDWIGAWAHDDATDQPLLPVVPGKGRQREMALRFGINVVMHALTGNYKGDQVHVPAIMERLTQ